MVNPIQFPETSGPGGRVSTHGRRRVALGGSRCASTVRACSCLSLASSGVTLCTAALGMVGRVGATTARGGATYAAPRALAFTSGRALGTYHKPPPKCQRVGVAVLGSLRWVGVGRAHPRGGCGRWGCTSGGLRALCGALSANEPLQSRYWTQVGALRAWLGLAHGPLRSPLHPWPCTTTCDCYLSSRHMSPYRKVTTRGQYDTGRGGVCHTSHRCHARAPREPHLSRGVTGCYRSRPLTDTFGRLPFGRRLFGVCTALQL